MPGLVVGRLVADMGKYRALQDHLASSSSAVRMSFADIEQLVGPLPDSARQYRPWWANTRENRSQARAWMNAGYLVGQVNLTAETIQFVPDGAGRHERADDAGPHAAPPKPRTPVATSAAEPPDWERVLVGLASRLAEHVDVGLEHLLTEDIVRWELVGALRDAGVLATAIHIEYPQPEISAKFDLVIGDPATSVVELKYPRDPTSSGAADTMTTGEILRDLYRLAWIDVEDAWAIQILQPRILAHLRRRPEFDVATNVGESIVLAAGLRQVLPRTAAACLPEWTDGMSVRAECRFSAAVGTLALVGYAVMSVRA
jgi:hypothetical protein